METLHARSSRVPEPDSPLEARARLRDPTDSRQIPTRCRFHVHRNRHWASTPDWLFEHVQIRATPFADPDASFARLQSFSSRVPYRGSPPAPRLKSGADAAHRSKPRTAFSCGRTWSETSSQTQRRLFCKLQQTAYTHRSFLAVRWSAPFDKRDR